MSKYILPVVQHEFNGFFKFFITFFFFFSTTALLRLPYVRKH